MAYMSQENKKQLAPAIKAVLKKYNMKGTISVRNYSTLEVNIKSGSIDFNVGDRGYTQVNHYWIETNYEGIAQEFLLELNAAMNVGNWDKSDRQTDYFNVKFYTQINIGDYSKPYLIAA
jgi:hypothetical protein